MYRAQCAQGTVCTHRISCLCKGYSVQGRVQFVCTGHSNAQGTGYSVHRVQGPGDRGQYVQGTGNCMAQAADTELIIDIHKFWFVPARLFKDAKNMKELLLAPFCRKRKAVGYSYKTGCYIVMAHTVMTVSYSYKTGCYIVMAYILMAVGYSYKAGCEVAATGGIDVTGRSSRPFWPSLLSLT